MIATGAVFSPANALLFYAKQLCAEIHPGTFSFPRWRTDGTRLWLESSSRSTLLTIDFQNGQVRVPDWKCERDNAPAVFPIPDGWMELHAGSLFDRTTGDALDREAFDKAMADESWKGGRI